MNELSLILFFFILPLICLLTYLANVANNVLKSSYKESVGIIIGSKLLFVFVIYVFFLNCLWLPLSDHHWLKISEEAIPLFEKIGYGVISSWVITPILIYLMYCYWSHIKSPIKLYEVVKVEKNIRKRVPKKQVDELLNKLLNEQNNGYGGSYKYNYFTNKEIIQNYRKLNNILSQENVQYLISIENQLAKIINNIELLGMDETEEYNTFYFFNTNYYYKKYLDGDVENNPEIQGVDMIVKGTIGEEEVKKEIENYFYYESERLYDVNLKVENGAGKINKFENDVILINSSGIYTIEIKNKNYGGKLIINSDGSTNELGNSLTSQMDYHEKLLKLYLFKEFPQLRDKLHNIVKSFAVLTNENVEVINNCYDSYKIIKKNMIGSQIKLSDQKLLTEKEIKQIFNKIKKESSENKEGKYPFFDITEDFIKNRIAVLEKHQQEIEKVIENYNDSVVKYYNQFRDNNGNFKVELNDDILTILEYVQ